MMATSYAVPDPHLLFDDNCPEYREEYMEMKGANESSSAFEQNQYRVYRRAG